MHALLALIAANALDQLRRSGTIVLAAVGVLAILSLRWFSAFGLGYEVVQLKEMAVYTIGLLAALAAFLAALPREEETVDGAEMQLLTRPVSPWVISVGTWLGRLACLAALMFAWTLATYGALWWFQLADPRLFSYRGATSAFEEGHAVIIPVLAQFMIAAILFAFAQPLSRTRRPLVIALGLVGIYLLGYAAPAFGEPWVRLLPDFGRHDLTRLLWHASGIGWTFASIVHAAAWCAVGLGLDAGALRLRMAV
jgi:hypothetical protein